MLDLKIGGGLVLDGDGKAPVRTDVGIRGGCIAAVGDLRGEPAAQSLDAGGLCVAPGFIDIHAHYGTFARVLGHYVRREGVLALPEAVRRMTALPPEILGLGDRGRLRAGAAADVVVFDPATITDRATFAEPLRYPRGVHTVLVNGTAVVREGRETGATPGRVLRRHGG